MPGSTTPTGAALTPATGSATAGEPVAFPPGFVWGTATSAFQIEGGSTADGRGESIWDRFCAQPGTVLDGSDGSVATDHYGRYRDDVALLAGLGMGAYRFSIAWPRVLPAGTGAVNEAGLDFYDRLVDELLAANITPYPTLYHWDLPQALEDRGGWVSRDVTDAFVEYAAAVVGRLGDRVRSWATLNEPFVSATHGYWEGVHAPGRTSLEDCLAAAHHLLLAHGKAVPVIRELAGRAGADGAEVGIVLNFTPTTPYSDEEADVERAALLDAIENRWYVEPVAGLGYPEVGVAGLGWDRREVRDGDLDTIATPLDFLGVNYYSRQVARAGDAHVEPTLPVTAMGWEIHPQGIGDLLVGLDERHGFPKYLITENGAAMPDDVVVDGAVHDRDRIAYIADHLTEVHRAIGAGVPVEGYFVWSFLDNFEWAYGYARRFGIVHVDYETLVRTPKASARWYAEVARTGTVARPT
ncbi:MAG: GH1 family beta-glucosidase [Actinomycetota bacterium]|nr:GH1 family beta-glucosidase [Actinomycetota bacterium]